MKIAIAETRYAGLFNRILLTQHNELLTIVSPGTQKRNFTHIDDIIDGLILVGENGYGDEFDIGSDEAFSILEVANMYNK